LSATFDEFYATHFSTLVAQLRAGIGDLAEAQDVVQEAFCRAWSRWDRVSDYDDPQAWVRRVAWNLAVSRWRRTRTALRYVAGQTPVHVTGPGPDRVVLDTALARLPVNHRRAVVLYYLADMSAADIARDCGVSESTVRSWLHRARAALFQQLSAPGEEVPRGTLR
jgi:RNA polymerase sigma-70 factor (ECF subfamily)